MKISGFIQKIRGFLHRHFLTVRGLFSILVFIPVLLIPGCGEALSEDSFELRDCSEETLAEDALPEDVGEDFIYVYVCGRVSKPGVYSVSEDCRIFECLQLAGGVCEDADISGINQAGKVSDGQQIYVPSVSEPKEAGSTAALKGAGPPSGADDGLVNINLASADELTKITGIGKTRAQSIVEYRDQNGRFEKPEDIMKVPGIKEGLFSKISGQIKVD